MFRWWADGGPKLYAGWEGANSDEITRSTLFDKVAFLYTACADPGKGTGSLDPPKNPQNIGFLSNTGPGLLKNHKTSKLLFNV